MKIKFFENKTNYVVSINGKSYEVYKSSLNNVADALSTEVFTTSKIRNNTKTALKNKLSKFDFISNDVYVAQFSGLNSGIVIIDLTNKFAYGYFQTGDSTRVWKYGHLKSYETGSKEFNVNSYKIDIELDNVPSDIKEKEVESEESIMRSQIRKELEATIREEMKIEFQAKLDSFLAAKREEMNAKFDQAVADAVEEKQRENKKVVIKLEEDLSTTEIRLENVKSRLERQVEGLTFDNKKLRNDVKILTETLRNKTETETVETVIENVIKTESKTEIDFSTYLDEIH